MKKKSLAPTQKWDNLPYHRDFDRKPRGKSSWAGISLGDAFKNNLDYYAKKRALAEFFSSCARGQRNVALLTGSASDSNPKVKPQLGPCYTQYPPNLAAHAAIGLTLYLEYQARVPQKLLRVHLQEYLKNPAQADCVSADSAIYLKVVEMVIRAVNTRILLADLARVQMWSVERFRLFTAEQQTMKCESLAEIIEAGIIFGDLLPDWRHEPLHPTTRSIYDMVSEVSQPFSDRLSTEKPHEWVGLGCDWVRAVARALAPYLPKPGQGPEAKSTPTHDDWIPPLDDPQPPMLEPPTAAQRLAAVFKTGTGGAAPGTSPESPEAAATRKEIEAFEAAVNKAGGQQTKSEDMRSDLVEQAMRVGGFRESPIQGTPTDGHEVEVQLGKDTLQAGTIHDRPIDMGPDPHAGTRLLEESRPITEALRRTIFPNVEELHEIQRLRTSGALDGARLPMGEFSQAVFKRYPVHTAASRKGAPVVGIICDHSGSVGAQQTWMLKRLTAAWLESTARTQVRVLAALYHDVTVRNGICGPLIEWVYHPQKTPFNRRDAVRALASIPDAGSGNQSDVLALSFFLDEAAKIARNKTIYLIHITDTQFCPSFHCGKDARQEMLAFLQSAYERFADHLHFTLVALGVEPGKSGYEQAVDHVIPISYQELNNCTAVAERVAVYVASIMKERRKLMAKR